MLSNTHKVHTSLHPKRANNVKTSCKNYCLLCVLMGFLDQFHSPLEELFLSFAPTVCTSRKGSQLNKRSQNVENTMLDMQSEPLKSTLPFLHKFHPFLPDDTISVENMKQYAQCLKIICAACFVTDSCHENFPQTWFSSCCQPFYLSQ